MKIRKRERASIDNTPCEWVEYGDGVAFELYGIAHPLYVQAQIKLARREQEQDLLNLSEVDGIEQSIKIVGRYLVKDWRGIVGDDDEPLACNYDNFVDLVAQVDGLFTFVLEQSLAIQERHAKAVDNTKKKRSKDGGGKDSH